MSLKYPFLVEVSLGFFGRNLCSQFRNSAGRTSWKSKEQQYQNACKFQLFYLLSVPPRALLPIKRYGLKLLITTSTRVWPDAGLALVFRASSHTRRFPHLYLGYKNSCNLYTAAPRCGYRFHSTRGRQHSEMRWRKRRRRLLPLMMVYEILCEVKPSTLNSFTITITRTNDSNTLQTHATNRRDSNTL